MKKQQKLQSRGMQDPKLSKGAESEREKTTSRPGTGDREIIKPANSREVSPNTPPGEDI